MTDTPKELYTFALVVFESLFPKITGGSGDERPKLVGPKNSSNLFNSPDAQSAFKYSGSQNEFSGYFKLIPLNIAHIRTSSSTSGHKFSVDLDPSLLYVEIDPTSVSQELVQFLDKTTLSNEENIQTANYMVGFLEGMSREAMATRPNINIRKYYLPGELFAQLVAEMDTATIFMINELGEFQEDIIMRLYGGSLSRINEFDVSTRSQELIKIGILPNTQIPNTGNSNEAVTARITALRNFTTNTGLISLLGIGGTASRVYSPSNGNADYSRNALKTQEEKVLKEASNNISSGQTTQSQIALSTNFTNTLGPAISKVFVPAFRASSDTNIADALLHEQQQYYKSNPISYLMSWSMYKNIQIAVGENTAGSMLFSSSNQLANDRAKSLGYVFGMDLIAAQNYPNLYSQLRQNYDISILNRLADTINADYGLGGTPNAVDSGKYLIGLSFFTGIINQMINDAQDSAGSLQAEFNQNTALVKNTDNSAGDIISQQDLQNLNIPLSSNTPGFIMKGHISSITTSSTVGDREYSKKVTIDGEGAELPLKRHTIFYDQINTGRELYFQALNFALQTSTPINAALRIMNTFAPDYVKIRNANSADIFVEANQYKNTALFKNKHGQVVEQGVVVYPSPDATEDQALFATPLHYVHNGFLHVVQEVFDEVRLKEHIIVQLNQGLPQTNIYNVLDQVLAKGSAYTWFVDEFGFIKVRYENSAAVGPYPTLLSPIIDDSKIINVSTRTDETNIYTMTEVVPSTFAVSSPAEGRIQGVFGRATPPTVDDYYALYEIVPLDVQKARNDVIKLLKSSLSTFQKTVLESYNDFRKTIGKNFPTVTTLKNGLHDDLTLEPVYHSAGQLPSVSSVVSSLQAPTVIPTGQTETKKYPMAASRVDKFIANMTNAAKTTLGSDLQPFVKKVIQVSDNLNIDPHWLMAIMQAESQLDPTAQNSINATGLIQFVPLNNGTSLTTAGVTPEDLLSMTREQQMDYVETFLSPQKGNMTNLLTTYLAVFWPLGLTKGGTDIINQNSTSALEREAYTANQSLDTNNDGIISSDELLNFIMAHGYQPVFGSLPLGTTVNNENNTNTTNVSQPTTKLELPALTKPEQSKYYSPEALSAIFVQQPVFQQSGLALSLQEYKVSSRVYYDQDLNIWGLNTTDVFSHDYTKNGENIGTYFDYISSEVQKRIQQENFPSLGNIDSFTFQGIDKFLKLLATLSMFGVGADNVEASIDSDSPRGQLVRLILSKSKVYVNPRKLNTINVDSLVLKAVENRELPYENYALQETRPSQVSADLFRYGLRILRMDDMYLSSLQLTSFRAEAIRRLHEEPIRRASVTILGNPMYKVGNTVLLSTKAIEERKYNYINYGTIKTLNDLGENNESFIFKVDDLIDEGVEINYSHPFSHGKVTKDGIRQHFIDAYNFIADHAPRPVTSSIAYVPLYGAYSTDNGTLNNYLSLLAQMSLEEYQKDFTDLENQLEDTLIQLTTETFGQNFGVDSMNNLINLISPQYYHVYQYYIENIEHDWTFGETYRTSLNMNYGQPASLCVIPVDANKQASPDYGNMHILGWLLNKSPYMLYNDRGKKSDKITIDHPLYRFALSQQAAEWNFYKSGARYNVSLILEKIRRKILYPDIYGKLY